MSEESSPNIASIAELIVIAVYILAAYVSFVCVTIFRLDNTNVALELFFIQTILILRSSQARPFCQVIAHALDLFLLGLLFAEMFGKSLPKSHTVVVVISGLMGFTVTLLQLIICYVARSTLLQIPDGS